jgi:HSP20 family protein
MFNLKPWRKTAPLPRFETPFGWMLEEFPGLFNRMLSSFPIPEMPEYQFPWGVMTEEKENEILMRFELPGFEPTELKVQVFGERLLIEAEHKEPAAKPEEKVEKKEAAYARIRREVMLPVGVEPEKVEAVYRNGVLEVHLPRKPEAMGRLVEVKTGPKAMTATPCE